MFDLWQEIFSTIKRNKLRTALTGFSVAWGIFILLVLLGAGNGLIHAFEKASGERAVNSVNIYPGRTTKPFDGFKEGRPVKLDNLDLKSTREMFPENIITTGAIIWHRSTNISYGSEYVNLSMSGVYPNHIEVEAIKMFEGRFLNKIDIDEKRKVMVVHKKSADILFNKTGKEPIGQFVNAAGVAYQIVGIYNDEGTRSDNEVFIPFTTLQLIYNKGNELDMINFTTKGLTSIEGNEAFEADYRKVIGSNHRFDPSDKSALWIWNRFTQFLQQETGMSLLRTSIWIIGLFTLLSGIVGVSNIMLITVKERTREFGIRKALGAKPAQILFQIIIESIVITTIFGYIGMVAGVAATEWMNVEYGSQVMDAGVFSETFFLNPTVDIGTAINATLTLIIAGTLAGFFPARKAVSISPIEALRAD